jgi:hypothetical protein
MAFFPLLPRGPIGRRHFLTAGLAGAAGLALYSAEIARHAVEVTRHDLVLANLPAVFDGMRIVQISDIHMDAYTEPFFLRRVVAVINGLAPDAVFITGDFVTDEPFFRHRAVRSAWQCASILEQLQCRQRYAVLGNHDIMIGAHRIAAALEPSGITVLRNACLPLERPGGRIWLAGLDDPVDGRPQPDLAIPPAIRNRPDEPILLLCHAPDYADYLLNMDAGQSVALMFSGHTHGGQICLPLLGSLALPRLGRKYVAGAFQLDALQLYVNRGIGAIGLPFRFNCSPEITHFILRRG